MGSVRGLWSRLALALAAAFAIVSPAAAGGALPDGRAYEQVSPVNKNFVDVWGGPREVRSSASGETVTFPSTLPFPGVEGAAEIMRYLAVRGEAGWATSGLLPRTEPGSTGTNVVGFSEDLSKAVVITNSPPPGATGGEAGKYNMYLRDNATGSWGLFAKAGEAGIAASTPDGSRILFETEKHLVPEAGEEVKLYEWHNGAVSLAGRLPNGKAPAEGSAAGGSGGILGNAAYTQNTISNDGKRVFFTDRETKELYVRENGTQTVAISPGEAVFRGASPDGSRVLFTENGGLYKWIGVEGGPPPALTTIVPAGKGALGVAGMGGEGAYVYFVATSKLTSALNPRGAEALAGEDNLYLWHEGEPVRFIAVLSKTQSPGFDRTNWATGDNYEGGGTEFGAAGEGKSAQVTPDGTRLLFSSYGKPTGYENHGPRCVVNTATEEGAPGYCSEIYLYDASGGTGTLGCVSCNPSGASAQYPAELYSLEKGVGLAGIRPTPAWIPRNLSEDGRRVFFQTREALSPQDENGQLDVYEWEQAGEGSCPSGHEGGCVYLISSGQSPEPSYFAEASANGDNAFLFTRQGLVGQDTGENQDLYDARVGGGFAAQNPPPAPAPCAGEACRGVPPPPPAGSLASAVFSGQGNLAPPAEARPRPLTRAQKLAKALKACGSKPKKRRAACVKQAHKRYGGKAAGASRRMRANGRAGR